jgi:drug/metabolite transporter (DMT)-like permease
VWGKLLAAAAMHAVVPMTSWIWIPIVVAAAAAQTVRNAAQRSLVSAAGTLPATLVRFVYGLPFAVAALAAVHATGVAPLPVPGRAFMAWVAVGAVAQLVATACLIGAMERRSFVVAVAYSKTEILQIGIFSIVLLGESLSLPAAGAIALASAGVYFLSVKPLAERRDGESSWISAAAALGLVSGGAFALSAVGYRAATLTLEGARPWVAGIYALVWAQAIQSLLLGGYLLARDRAGLARLASEWRVSTLAGLMGALASMCWFTAFAMRSAVDVRIVGLVEVFFSYALSRQFFKEPITGREIAGIVLTVAGIVVISTFR